MTGRDHEPERRSLAFGKRVRRDGGRPAYERDIPQEPGATGRMRQLRGALDDVHERQGKIVRGRFDLDLQCSAGAGEYGIGHGAAGVHVERIS